MKIIKANEAKELFNKFHQKQTAETSKLISSHLAKVFTNFIKANAKLGSAEAKITNIVEAFKRQVDDNTLNDALITENIKAIALENDYKIQNNIIYW